MPDKYFPATHDWHWFSLVAPEAPENVPGEQGTHVVASCAAVAEEYMPAGHSAHTIPASGPNAVENFPAPQGEHVACVRLFNAVENVPGGHNTHACACGAPWMDTAVVFANLPAGQSVHVWWSGTSRNCPGVQGRTQALTEAEAVEGVIFPVGHGKHCASPPWSV